MRAMRAPQADHASCTLFTADSGFSGSGVRMTRRSRKSSALAASAPLFSAPAIGCAGTNWAIFRPSAARAAAMTSRLVLPPSVTSARGPSTEATSRNRRRNCATGVASRTRSAWCAAATASGAMESITPSSSARLRFAALRPAPTTCAQAFACLSASANEPPIRPTPTIATRSKSICSRLLPEARGGGGEECLVLVRGADGDPQVLGQAVARHRAYDHSAAQEALEDLGRLAHADGEEVAVRGNVGEPERSRALLELAHPAQVHGVAARNELHVVEGRGRGGEADAAHVEGLAHAVHHVGDRRVRERGGRRPSRKCA